MANQTDYSPQDLVKISTPDWVRDAVIYQLNTRQFTAEGTLNAAREHLPRLKSLGVDVLWLMPINSIGEKNRKGSLGSPYAVKDYFAVNPEFGTLEDLKVFVSESHNMGMRVIVDWVANHSAWDNVLVEKHPEWYARDHHGQFRPTPWWDWDDIIDFDYRHKPLREYMANAMVYWVKEVDIDGFRCDVAGFVPNDFWANVRAELESIKPVLMLAEWESRDLHFDSFDMTYAWSWNETMHKIAMGKESIDRLRRYYSWNEKSFPKQALRMTFVSNHDKNAWDGTQFEQFGGALEAAIVLSVLGEGIPLIYNGQEAGNPKRLAFFERDPIDWRAHAIGDFYHSLIQIKKAHSCLHNGQWGASMIPISNNKSAQIFSFVRQDKNSKVFVVLNLSANACYVRFSDTILSGCYADLTGTSETFSAPFALNMPPWGYRVFIENGGAASDES